MATNVEILAELREIHQELLAHKSATEPLVAIVPELKAMAELYSAGRVGGSALKWLAMLGASIIGLIAFMKMAIGGMIPPSLH